MKMVELNNVARFVNGYAFKPSDWVSDGLKIIRIQNLTDLEKTYNRTQKQVPDKYRITKGDILVSWSATLDVFEWEDDEDALLNQHIFKVEPKSNVVDKKYFKYVLRYSIEKMSQFTHGSTMKHIVREDFLKHNIPLPPIEDQKRVVRILDQAGTLCQKRKQAIEFLDDYLKSVFLEMFGDPVKNPKGWDRIPLLEILLKIESGHSPVCLDRPAVPGDWGVLKLGAITKCVYNPTENKALPDAEKPNPDIEIRAGDILFSRKNTYELVAACAYVWETPSKLMMSDLIFRLVPRDKKLINSIFLHALLSFSSKRKMIQRLAGGAAGSMPNISKAKLFAHKIEIPPLPLQNRFAAIVEKTQSLEQKVLCNF
ncbi:MAG: restriction endonuclease subunit S [Deltaproteobacteria bacterium]